MSTSCCSVDGSGLNVLYLQDVVCQDGSECPPENTCCLSDPSSHMYSCCSLTKAVCCTDGKHCCPQNYVNCCPDGLCCPAGYGTCCPGGKHCCADDHRCNGSICIGPSGTSSRPVPGSFGIGTMRSKATVDFRPAAVSCSDKSLCSGSQTCCWDMELSLYTCCPLPNGICCNSLASCCPAGYECGPGTCKRKGHTHPITRMLKLQPSHNNSSSLPHKT